MQATSPKEELPVLPAATAERTDALWADVHCQPGLRHPLHLEHLRQTPGDEALPAQQPQGKAYGRREIHHAREL